MADMINGVHVPFVPIIQKDKIIGEPVKKVGDEYVGNTRLPGGAVTKPGGHGVTMVLMKKRKEWFDEDYSEKMSDIDRVEKGLIKRAQLDNLHAAPDTDGIKIDRPGR